MKSIAKFAMTFLIVTVLSFSIAEAQENPQLNKPIQRAQINNPAIKSKPILTDAQKAMLKDAQQKKKTAREEFKTTITQKQKDILSDPRLIKIDRRRAFRASLTDKQVLMIKAMQQQMKESKDKFRSTLTDQQKKKIKKMVANRIHAKRHMMRAHLVR